MQGVHPKRETDRLERCLTDLATHVSETSCVVAPVYPAFDLFLLSIWYNLLSHSHQDVRSESPSQDCARVLHDREDVCRWTLDVAQCACVIPVHRCSFSLFAAIDATFSCQVFRIPLQVSDQFGLRGIPKDRISGLFVGFDTIHRFAGMIRTTSTHDASLQLFFCLF